MYFSSSDFDLLDEASFRDFLDYKLSEFYYLDYKRTIEYNAYFKQEFLKDVSAFANAFGGNLIYGVDEPKENVTVEDQIYGVDNADDTIKKFEKLAQTGLDPRIPGLKMKSINIKGKKPVIVAHIPPSISKPHMISIECDKKGLFYIRGTESNIPMNTQQIRSAVMETYNTESRVLNTLIEKEAEFKNYELAKETTFFFQAIPLVNTPPEKTIHETDVRKAFKLIKGNDGYDLGVGHKFSPIMQGVKAEYNYSDYYTHIFNIQHNGYMESILKTTPYYIPQNNPNIKVIPVSKDSPSAKYFNSILKLTDDLINELRLDYPFLLSCKLFNTKELMFKGEFNSSVYERPIMRFSQITRSIGSSALKVAHNRWLSEFFHAFGQYPPTELLLQDD